MGISIGGIDLANSVISNELRIAVLEAIVEKLAGGSSLTQSDIDGFRARALADLKKKYPEAGIKGQ